MNKVFRPPKLAVRSGYQPVNLISNSIIAGAGATIALA